MYMIEEKNMCDEDDSDEILEYTGGSELSDLTFISTYDYYSSWRIKEVFREAGYELKPVFLGYKVITVQSVSEILDNRHE